jgi:hypothetical protein
MRAKLIIEALLLPFVLLLGWLLPGRQPEPEDSIGADGITIPDIRRLMG